MADTLKKTPAQLAAEAAADALTGTSSEPSAGLAAGRVGLATAAGPAMSTPPPAPVAPTNPLKSRLQQAPTDWSDPALAGILSTQIPGVTYPTTGVPEPTWRDALSYVGGGGATPAELQALALEQEKAQRAKWYR